MCALIPALPTLKTQVVLLQHPRERRMAIGTARMAHLALPGSLLRVGLDFAEDPVVNAALTGPGAPHVLFPGSSAVDVRALPADRPITLVVLDGTWSQAKKLLRLNPALARLPRVSFRAAHPSAYLIRRQPALHCLSTIEALSEVLGALEPDGARFERLLEPFRAMVGRQAWFADQVKTGRHRRARLSPPGETAVVTRLRAAWDHLVCVHGEVNAWPRRAAERNPNPPELVHWLAERVATGETFEVVIAPRRPLAPATANLVAIDEPRLRAGLSMADAHAAFARFLGPDDHVVHWGSFYTDIAAAEGFTLPAARTDLRRQAAHQLRRRPGTVDVCASALNAPRRPATLTGRGGKRLAAMVSVLAALAQPLPTR